MQANKGDPTGYPSFRSPAQLDKCAEGTSEDVRGRGWGGAQDGVWGASEFPCQSNDVRQFEERGLGQSKAGRGSGGGAFFHLCWHSPDTHASLNMLRTRKQGQCKSFRFLWPGASGTAFEAPIWSHPIQHCFLFVRVPGGWGDSLHNLQLLEHVSKEHPPAKSPLAGNRDYVVS